jgi:hypothetical protein
MTLPSSGSSISASEINTEFRLASNATLSLSTTSVRTLGEVASGAISLSNFHGKQYAFKFAISANTTNANLRTLAVAAGWDQSLPVIATIDTGVVISGSVVANSTAALTIDGSWPSGVKLINKGTIAGMGGTGQAGRNASGAATAGGRGLLLSSACSIDNTNGTIAGGGGGGAGGSYASGTYNWTNNQNGNSGQATAYTGGGGGGGGRGGNVASTGGAKGSNSGGAGNAFINGQAGGPNPTAGNGGTFAGPGSGGQGGTSSKTDDTGSVFSVQGGDGSSGYDWGAGGSLAGQSIFGNSFVTWIGVGLRYGTIS